MSQMSGHVPNLTSGGHVPNFEGHVQTSGHVPLTSGHGDGRPFIFLRLFIWLNCLGTCPTSGGHVPIRQEHVPTSGTCPDVRNMSRRQEAEFFYFF